MATATVSINQDFLEENAREMREVLARSFSEARRRLDEREAQLSLQLEEKINEVKIHNKSNIKDREQLKSVLELMQSGLSSNNLQETGNEAVKPIIERLDKLEMEQMRIQLNWSPHNLYQEISKIGEVCTTYNDKSLTEISSELSEYNVNEEILILPPYRHQKQEINSLLRRPFQKGEYFYLIHIRWFKQWMCYVGYDNWDKSNAGNEEIKPGPIDNTSLLDQGKLRRHQVDEIDYKLVPEEAWYKLLSWYGIGRDSIGIKRQVIEYGKFVKRCKVEVYFLELKACLYPKESEFKIVTISRCDTIHTLDMLIRQIFNIESTKHTRVYNRNMTYTYELIKDMNLEAHDVELLYGQCITLEVQNMDGTWPRKSRI